jgi:hypothetical protein
MSMQIISADYKTEHRSSSYIINQKRKDIHHMAFRGRHTCKLWSLLKD